ncbi:DNA polymerase III subunit alpha [Gulosibacter macacae]|uniref:DNA polymerase III subunit alpha n=1 Tax=Gulosibacter macacae TaxID=2488791 RepID=A0A3P3VYM5_9MICO|nr:DNA polymerase III subunit alpha [Gulosibacter macacae]RRJ87895.1 DNA polymerase III subunit alpha [Gulosibacter macacae]
MSAFPHLHVASAFSTHHGTSAPEALVARAAEWGAEAAAITDRDGLYGAVRHIRACIAAGVAPVVGVDLALEGGGEAGVSIHRLPAALDQPKGGHLTASLDQPKGGRLTAAHFESLSAPGGLSAPDAVKRPRVTVLAHGANDGLGWAALSRLISAAHMPPRGANLTARRQHRAQLAPKRFSPFLLGEHDTLGTVLLGPHSDVGLALAAGRPDEARARIRSWQRQLPRAIALEIVCHLTEPGAAASLAHAAAMLELAHTCRIPAVLTNQVRYLDPDDALTGDVLDAAGELRPLGSFPPQPNAQAWLKSPDRMRALGELIVGRTGLGRIALDELLGTTAELAARCRLDPVSDVRWQQPKVPEPSVLGITGDPARALARRCEAALNERFPDAAGTERTTLDLRLRDELSTINGFGFATYFLAVADVTDSIRAMGVRNQARGSGASSLVNYLLRISNVNPIEHDLVFERFLGRKRSTLPDIDVDVESARRHDVYRMIFQRYGRERTALLSMHSTYRARGAARDAGLALGLDEARIDKIAKSLWRFNAGEFREVLKEKPELAKLADEAKRDRDLDLLIDLAERLDRLPRHLSMHPCGVLIGDATLLSTTPVQPSGLELPMSQYDKDDIDDMGLLKLDVLGVRMQSALAYAVGEISRMHGPQAAVRGGLAPDTSYVSRDGHVVLDDIPKDDEVTFEAIRTTHTLGMFQIESPGQRELIGKMQPDVYDDLIADISLFRPGPMKGNMVAPFLDVKHGFATPDWLHPSFRPFLAETYGVVVYHEQVLRILHECMGIDLAEADELRRLMEKRGQSIEERFRRETAKNRDAQGRRKFTDAQIDRIWDVLKGFGSFGFCKAHAAAFALPTWQTAWLKTHYPAEFFAGLLTHDPGMYPKRLLLGDARRLGIPILPVDVNVSTAEFVVERVRDTAPGTATAPGDLGIRLSLADIRGISEAELARIQAHAPYESLGDFLGRARPSRPLAERLALIGALDELEPARPTRGELITAIRSRPRARKRKVGADVLELPLALEGGHAPVDHVPVEAGGAPDLDARARVQAELEVLALDLSEHVIDGYRPLLDELGVTPAGELLGLRGGAEVIVAGVRVATQTPPMRSGKRVVFISVDDGSGCADATFFEDAQQASGEVLFGTPLLVIHGTVRRTGERGVSVQATSAQDLKQLWEVWSALRARAS